MKELIEYFDRLNEKKFLVSVLNWELDTIAPIDSYDYYNNEVARIQAELFEMSTSSKYIDLINNAINSNEFKELTEEKRICILDLKEQYEREKKIPKDFYEEYVKLTNKSKQVWVDAKKKNDYELFRPYLEELIDKNKKLYRYMYGDIKDIYGKMIGMYEKNVKTEDIDLLFENLKKEIIPIIKELNPKKLKDISKEYSDETLYKVSRYLLNYIGFDLNRGALGIFPHGYTETISKDDVRIAFSKTNNIFDHMSTIIHEGGHGIFEQKANEALSSINSYGVNNIALHESQSRFYENILGRNINFWIPIYDDIKNMLDINISKEEFIEYFNNAKPSLIRTEADELTYCLHIIIRYEIERDIFNNNIDISDLPNIWNKKYKDYLGIDVKNDSEGIMQDLHWSQGDFGYFPTYLLGTIFDGMLLEAINEKVGNVDEILKNGNIKIITNYLTDNIYKYAGAYNIFEVCKRVCNKELEVDGIVKYFKKKYALKKN